MMAAGVAGAIWLFSSDASHSHWELGLSVLCLIVMVVGAYWMIAALVGAWPFESWTPGEAQRPPGPSGPSGTSASPSAISGLSASKLMIEIQKARFGRADQRQWMNATKVVRRHLSNGKLDMVVSVTEFGRDPAYGFRKTLRIKYRINGGPSHRVEFTEYEHVRLP